MLFVEKELDRVDPARRIRERARNVDGDREGLRVVAHVGEVDAVGAQNLTFVALPEEPIPPLAREFAVERAECLPRELESPDASHGIVHQIRDEPAEGAEDRRDTRHDDAAYADLLR